MLDWCLIQPEQINYDVARGMSLDQLLESFDKGDNNVVIDRNAFGTCSPCINKDCILELTSQLLMILLIKNVAMKFVAYLTPKIMGLFTSKEKKEKFASRPWYEVECGLNFYSDVTDEYKEIALVYGYTILFASGFPIAPALSFFTTALELRSDAWKILNARRPMPQKVSDIGTPFFYKKFFNALVIAT
jgi:hypothetical protein